MKATQPSLFDLPVEPPTPAPVEPPPKPPEPVSSVELCDRRSYRLLEQYLAGR